MYNHILLATDLTPECERVARHAAKLANQQDAQLSIVHVIEPIPAYGYPGVTDLESPIIDEAKKKMADLGDKFNVEPGDQYICYGATKFEVLELTKKLSTKLKPVDLIVVGSHGRHGIARLLGSTADAILHGADCDVLVVRYKQEQPKE